MNNQAQKKAEANELKLQGIKEAAENQYLRASFSMARALKLFGEAGDKEQIATCKKLVVSYNKKAESEMHTHEFSIPLDQKTKNGLLEIVNNLTKGESLESNIQSIVISRALVPELEVAQRNAKEIVPITFQLATHMTMDKDGNLKSLDNFEDGWLAQNYSYQMQVCTMLLNSVFSELIVLKQFDEKALLESIVSREIFSEEHLMKMQIALERRFANDYFSAIHVLVPLLEQAFMSLSALIDLDVITYSSKKVSTRNGMLSAHILESKEYTEAWGKDFCYMLKFFLLDEEGFKFRHKVAHGEISVAECNFTAFNILLFFYLKMLFMIKKTEVQFKEISQE
jgi:hypothetical protein